MALSAVAKSVAIFRLVYQSTELRVDGDFLENRGKKRALIAEEEEPPTEAPVKRSKCRCCALKRRCSVGTDACPPARAETRPCPICKEKIPLRLLGKHAALEAERIDYIIQQIGSDQPIRDQYEEECVSSLIALAHPPNMEPPHPPSQTWATCA